MTKKKPRPSLPTFTAVLQYPGEPPRYFHRDFERVTTRPPRTLSLPSLEKPTSQVDTFALTSSASWPTVAIYTLISSPPAD
ncbi:hypothetical protein [Subtercola endophyticus]|uniref:hypothetical protein n=1 Tax=Subtercola endophyticus TaxID=2895559 RepID=UPI001E50BB87|nr:hypothetical protein [Subtercola endophyticus]UFS60257.1 hypothetical protein LQ955_05760 [Subtercola endophyticus]